MPGVAEYAASVLVSISGSVQGAIESSVIAAAQQQQRKPTSNFLQECWFATLHEPSPANTPKTCMPFIEP